MSDSLAHYGVLGMKWGVRKDGKPQGWQSDGSGGSRGGMRRSSNISAGATKKTELSDKQVEKITSKAEKLFNKGEKKVNKRLNSVELKMKAYNMAVERVNPRIDEFNKKWEGRYQNPDYRKAYQSWLLAECNKAAAELAVDLVLNDKDMDKAFKLEEQTGKISDAGKRIRDILDEGTRSLKIRIDPPGPEEFEKLKREYEKNRHSK